MDKKYVNEMLKEQRFPYENMTLEERDLCLKYIKSTKEFMKANIVQSNLYKIDNKYILNGLAYIPCNNNEFENRTFESEIIIEKDVISIFSNITRLYGKDTNYPKVEVFEVCDYFSKKNNKIIQETHYFNPNKEIGTKFDIVNEFDRFYELSNINNTKDIQK